MIPLYGQFDKKQDSFESRSEAEFTPLASQTLRGQWPSAIADCATSSRVDHMTTQYDDSIKK